MSVLWQKIWRDWRFRMAFVGFLALLVFAVVGPMLRPFHAEWTDWQHTSAPPTWSNGHWFGTDAIGRDIFVRTAISARLSLVVGLLAAICALAIGLCYGALAGFWGGLRERLMMRALDVISALPFLLIVILLLTLFGRSFALLMFAIGAFVWFDLARVARAETQSIKHQAYVDAAKMMGASDWFILRRHVLPNLSNLAVVYAALLVPQAILVESFLSFLGLSVEQPSTSLGAMLFDGTQEMQDAPWSLLFPAACFVMLLLCLNFISDTCRDALDPRHESRTD